MYIQGIPSSTLSTHSSTPVSVHRSRGIAGAWS